MEHSQGGWNSARKRIDKMKGTGTEANTIDERKRKEANRSWRKNERQKIKSTNRNFETKPLFPRLILAIKLISFTKIQWMHCISADSSPFLFVPRSLPPLASCPPHHRLPPRLLATRLILLILPFPLPPIPSLLILRIQVMSRVDRNQKLHFHLQRLVYRFSASDLELGASAG